MCGTGNGEKITRKEESSPTSLFLGCLPIDTMWWTDFDVYFLFRASFITCQLSPKVRNITKGNNTFDSSLNQPGQQNWAINFPRIASQEISSISEWVRNQYQWPISCHVLASGFLERKRDTDLHEAETICFHQAVQALDYICLWDCPESLWTFSKLGETCYISQSPHYSIEQ